MQQPVRKKAHLESQQFLVVGRQVLGMTCSPRLDPHQRVERVTVERIRLPRPGQLRQVHHGAEIRQQQEPVTIGPLEHARGIDAHIAQHRGDAQVRPDVLFSGGRVHDDERRMAWPRHAKVTAKAGIRGGRGNVVVRESQIPAPASHTIGRRRGSSAAEAGRCCLGRTSFKRGPCRISGRGPRPGNSRMLRNGGNYNRVDDAAADRPPSFAYPVGRPAPRIAAILPVRVALPAGERRDSSASDATTRGRIPGCVPTGHTP